MKLTVIWTTLLFGAWQTMASGASPDPTRLSTDVDPLAQSLELNLDPSAETYSGTVRFHLNFRRSTNAFRLHADKLGLQRALLDGQDVELHPAEAGIVAVRSSATIPAGAHTFELGFTHRYSRDGTGIYKAVAEGRPYVFTQMEEVHARHSFPCWDEPGFKIPWTLTLRIPDGLEAVANAPVARARTTNGTKTIEFGRTPPMPAYLVAFAVGPLESLPVEGLSVPGNIVTAAGKSALARTVAADSPPLLSALERYFGIPYPYPKLDQVAVPEFLGGGMENAGLITYRDLIVLSAPDQTSLDARRLRIEVVAHEMAHMWFGDLVTMAWWDDLWLNESFATWISYKIAAQVHPDLGFEKVAYASLAAARDADEQPSVKAVRRAFRGDDNFGEAVDVLTYNKGQALLRMTEGWMGEEPFRQALQGYFLRHAWKNARADDLWLAFDEVRAGISDSLRRYVEQPGLPELEFTRLDGDRLDVRQHRFRVITAPSAPDPLWLIPLSLRAGGPEGTRTFRLMLTNEHTVFEVPGLRHAQWIYPNAGESGHYRWRLSPDLRSGLTEHAASVLNPVERMGALDNAVATLRSGRLSLADLLASLASASTDPDPEVRSRVVDAFEKCRIDCLEETDAPSVARLFHEVLRPMLDRIGLEPATAEAGEIASLRARLLVVLGTHGDEPDVVAFCRRQAARELDQPRSLPAALAESVLLVATGQGDEPWWTRIRNAFESASDPDLRNRYLATLGNVRSPALARLTLDYALSSAVLPAELLQLMGTTGSEPKLAATTFDWMVAHYEELRRKLPPDFLPYGPNLLNQGDPALLARGKAFFEAPERRTPLIDVNLRKAAETVQLREALRRRYEADRRELRRRYDR